MLAFLSPRMCAAAIAPLLAVSGALLTAVPAHAASANLVISEVYGGGGNSGSTWTNDFVELYNSSDAPVDVTGWVVQYYSGTGGAGKNATLTGSVAPQHSYLVQMAKGAGGTTPLPTPDATGDATMSATRAWGRWRGSRSRCHRCPRTESFA
jgi:predicted extracellular nuclease